jgi:hypothetical protein
MLMHKKVSKFLKAHFVAIAVLAAIFSFVPRLSFADLTGGGSEQGASSGNPSDTLEQGTENVVKEVLSRGLSVAQLSEKVFALEDRVEGLSAEIDRLNNRWDKEARQIA